MMMMIIIITITTTTKLQYVAMYVQFHDLKVRKIGIL